MDMQRALSRAGLDSRELSRYGAHSLRAGFATVAYENGATELEITRQTGHTNVAMIRRYIHAEQKQRRNVAAKLGI